MAVPTAGAENTFSSGQGATVLYVYQLLYREDGLRALPRIILLIKNIWLSDWSGLIEVGVSREKRDEFVHLVQSYDL
jgi:hypothetical protein